MITFKEMDQHVTIAEQLKAGGGAVILVNHFTVEPEQVDELLAAWASDAAVMEQQDGYISTQMHRGIAGSSVFLNIAVWESVEQFRKAFENPEFHAKLSHYPSTAVTTPHLFRKIAVPGLCVA